MGGACGFFVWLECMRRVRLKHPNNPPSRADKLAKMMFDFYHPAAPYIALFFACVVWGGTMLLLYAAKQLVLVIGGQA